MQSLICATALFLPLAPAAETPLQRIAFGSCASQERSQPIWDAISAAKPDLFVFLGNNIYGDTDNVEILKQKYAQLATIPGFQRLIRVSPILATWDDHDFGMPNASGDFPGKAASQKVFLDFFSEPADSPRRQREGVYVAMTFGPPGKRVQVILLDTRYFRTPLKKNGSAYVPQTDPNATLLGAAQWKWLDEQLRQPAELRLIGSSIQVVADEHPYEKWANYPAERERLFALLRERKANGVVFLSGDRHLAELSQMDRGLGYPIFDLTSSGLNMANKRWRPAEINKHRVATMTSGDNFGLIVIDWDAAPPRVSLQVRDLAGDVTIQQKFDLPLLTPAAEAVATGAAPKPAAVKSAGAIPVGEAIKRVGDSVTVEFKVKNSGKTRDGARVFLNSGDRGDPENFTVTMRTADVGDKLKAAGVNDPAAYFKNKTIRVTGTVTLFQDKPQIVIEDAAMIGVVE